MSVTPDDVRHIAQLARLGVSDAAVPALVAQLNGILEHMQVLSEVDVPDDTTDSDFANGMPLRDDAASATPLSRDRESFAPAMRDGFFLVPRLATHGQSTSGSTAAGGDEDEG